MHRPKKYLVPALLVIFASLAMPRIIVFAQVELRVVHVLYPHDCPVDLRGLRVAEMPVEPQKPFEAGEGWLKDLSWEIENTWEKPTAYIEVNLDFHGLARLEDSAFKYQYGQVPNKSGEVEATKLLRPGQRTRMIISDEQYERIKSFIREKQPDFTISVVEMKVSKVVFEDGTIWPRRQKNERL